MKNLVVYSSKTGNTKKVAKAIALAINCENVVDINENPDASLYDMVFIGYWIDRGTADAKTLEFIKSVENKKIALFFTLGADPESEHAKMCLENAKTLISKTSTLAGVFCCQGKIDPNLIEMFKKLPKDHPHFLTKENLERYKKAAEHPNDRDLENASEFAKNVIFNQNKSDR